MQTRHLEDYEEHGYKIKIVRTREAFTPLHDKWDEALKAYDFSCLHLASGYLDCMWESYPEELEGALLIVEKEDKIVALAPLTKVKYNYRSIGFNAVGPLDFMRSGRSDCVVLYPEDRLMEVLQSATKKLGADLWHLDRFPVLSPVYRYFSTLPDSANVIDLYQEYDLAILETEMSWDDFIGRKSKNFRKNYRRILDGSDGFKKTLITNVHQNDRDFVEDMVEIVSRSWKEEAGSAITNDQRRIEFFTRLIKHYEKSGDFVAAVIFDVDKPIAFTFGIVFNNKLYAIETSYDDAYKGNSVGIASYAMIMKYAFDHDDIVICDMDTIKTNGNYKRRWATRIDQQVSALVLNGGMGSFAIRTGRQLASIKEKVLTRRGNSNDHES